MAIGNLVRFHQVNRDPDAALGLYQEPHQIGLLLTDTFLMADALMGTGEAQAIAGDIEEARIAWQGAVRLFEEIDHPSSAAARQRLAATGGDTAIAWTPTDWAAPRHRSEAEEPRVAGTENEDDHDGNPPPNDLLMVE